MPQSSYGEVLMKLEFVNHSSFVIKSGSVALLCDFWKDGAAFDDSWELLCPTSFDYSDFASITHLWFSHEHPDHFSPANLKSIPEELRKNITILFQYTEDKRVTGFCEKLGFKDVLELTPWIPTKLTDDFEISCAPYGAAWGDVDSWLCVRAGGKTLLNLNDCEIEDRDDLRLLQEHTGPIDLLATQFSFASKQGDADDPEWIDAARKYHLERLGTKVACLKPEYTLPFASFVYWSHQENRYLNEGAIHVDDAADCIAKSGSIPIVMYPDDKWSIGEKRDNGKSLAAYQARYEWLESLPETRFRRHDPVPAQKLRESADKMLEKMLSCATLRQIRQHLALQHSDIRTRAAKSRLYKRMDALWSGVFGRYEKPWVFVDDLRSGFEFSLENGLSPISCTPQQCHLRMNSEALYYCFAMPFGGETLQVNGRFQRISRDGWPFLRCTFFLARRFDQHFRLPRNVVWNWASRKLPLLNRLGG